MTVRIGVDPGSTTGIAVIIEGGGLHSAKSLDWDGDGTKIKAYLRLMWDIYGRGTLVVIEIPGAGFFPREGLSQGVQRKIAMNVGQCVARASEVAAYCEGLGFTVVKRRPMRGGTKRALSGETWRGIFKWQGRLPSNHARDAAMLALKI